MTDVLFAVRETLADRVSGPAQSVGLHPGEYYLATIHRAENTDDPERLRAVVEALAGLDRPVILLAHPRIIARAAAAGVSLTHGALSSRPPLAYADLIAAALGSAGVVTDSGGLQKEAFLLRVPCTTVRSETEWVETVDLGWNVLAESAEDIAAAVRREAPAPTEATPYGDGHAATRVIETLRV